MRPNFPEPSDEVYDSDDDTAEDSNNTVTNSEALVSSSVDPPTGNLKQLRHRKPLLIYVWRALMVLKSNFRASTAFVS